MIEEVINAVSSFEKLSLIDLYQFDHRLVHLLMVAHESIQTNLLNHIVFFIIFIFWN